MTRDPFYDKILERLGGRLDPESFEQCAGDLLRKEWPTLVPIRGGDDDGMDGAIADGKGPAYPLVVTTAEDGLGNLKHNLNRYLQKGHTRRKVVFATSRSLTARKRANLENGASKLGFNLVQVYDRAMFADLLYRDSKWCKELLGLAGDPVALSVVPRSCRPFNHEALVGRTEELTWLHRTSGDRLLAGQPGSGKTFLLRTLTEEGGGLFVISRERAEIAAGIREQQPEILIVDDAHINLELIADVLHLRETTGAKFSIVASCWPGAASEVAERMRISEGSTRELMLLAREEIGEIVRSLAKGFADWIVGEIADQAEGRPGLAATLTHLCRTGDFMSVLRGDALAESVRNSLRCLVSDTAIAYMAAFGIGGNWGMPLEVVAEELQKAPVDMRSELVHLAAAGVVTETGQGLLSVRPPPLRHALIRDVFFVGSCRLDCSALVNRAPQKTDTCKALIGAARLGAEGVHSIIRELLGQAMFGAPWELYAWLGPDEAKWVLENHGDNIALIARALLRHIPELVLPKLMEAAVDDERELHSATTHPLRLISDWIDETEPGRESAVSRRVTLLNAAREWIQGGGNGKVGLACARSALTVTFFFSALDPIGRRTATMRGGFLLPNEVEAVSALWPDVCEMFGQVNEIDWGCVLDIVHHWAYPHASLAQGPTEELKRIIRRTAKQMIRDVARLAGTHQGVRARLGDCARDLKLALKLPLEPDFEVLFPGRERGANWKVQEKRQAEAARKLAKSWKSKPPDAVAQRLGCFEREVEISGGRWPRWTGLVCSEIAKNVEVPVEWYRTLRRHRCSSMAIGGFFDRVVATRPRGWEKLVEEALNSENMRGPAVFGVLTMEDPPAQLLDAALGRLDELETGVEIECSNGRVPEATLLRLLQHANDRIAVGAAMGEWSADPEGSVRDTVREQWEEAVLRGRGDEFRLQDILREATDLACSWLKRYVCRDRTDCIHGEDGALAAASVLDRRQRLEVLLAMSTRLSLDGIVACLVGQDAALYADVLGNPQTKRLHLVPLHGCPGAGWPGLAKAALDAGYAAADVAEAAFDGLRSWWGEESEMWASWVEAFESIAVGEDKRLKEVVREGLKIASAYRNSAARRERAEAIRGWS